MVKVFNEKNALQDVADFLNPQETYGCENCKKKICRCTIITENYEKQ